mmetsp:Transcript_59303/g.158776  ORF Transcript_59303/g.158776 Transcript_59303/m.158776 type:complete len:325 (-) Transcript_59303:81-1055(-)
MFVPSDRTRRRAVSSTTSPSQYKVLGKSRKEFLLMAVTPTNSATSLVLTFPVALRRDSREFMDRLERCDLPDLWERASSKAGFGPSSTVRMLEAFNTDLLISPASSLNSSWQSGSISAGSCIDGGLESGESLDNTFFSVFCAAARMSFQASSNAASAARATAGLSADSALRTRGTCKGCLQSSAWLVISATRSTQDLYTSPMAKVRRLSASCGIFLISFTLRATSASSSSASSNKMLPNSLLAAFFTRGILRLGSSFSSSFTSSVISSISSSSSACFLRQVSGSNAASSSSSSSSSSSACCARRIKWAFQAASAATLAMPDKKC